MKTVNITDIIITDFEQKKDDIFRLDTLCGKHENSIAKELFRVLNWKLKKKNIMDCLDGVNL